MKISQAASELLHLIHNRAGLCPCGCKLLCSSERGRTLGPLREFTNVIWEITPPGGQVIYLIETKTFPVFFSVSGLHPEIQATIRRDLVPSEILSHLQTREFVKKPLIQGYIYFRSNPIPS